MKKSIDGRNLPELCTCQKCPRGIWLYICRDRTIDTVSVVHVGGEAYEWRIYRVKNQRTIGPENAHLKPDLGVLSHNEMTLTLNTHTP